MHPALPATSKAPTCYAHKFPQGGPKSRADFWDVEISVRALCVNDAPRSMIFALLADGVPREELYPLDTERAFKMLDRIKPHIKVWWREGNQSQQLIRDGEVDLMSIWNARACELKERGVPVELVWNGAVRSTSTWCVLKGAPNRKLAWEFINFASQAKPQAEFNTRLYYGPIHPGAYELIPRHIAIQLPTYPDNLAVSVKEDEEGGGSHRPDRGAVRAGLRRDRAGNSPRDQRLSAMREHGFYEINRACRGIFGRCPPRELEMVRAAVAPAARLESQVMPRSRRAQSRRSPDQDDRDPGP
jgi:hypothetical protein